MALPPYFTCFWSDRPATGALKYGRKWKRNYDAIQELLLKYRHVLPTKVGLFSEYCAISVHNHIYFGRRLKHFLCLS